MARIQKGDTVLTVGTRKGVFLLHSKDRRRWKSRGPYFAGDTVRHALLDPRDGRTIYAGVTSEHWGAIVSRSTDFGDTWVQGKEGPRFPKKSGLSITRIWQVQPGEHEDLYIGTEPAGLFRSMDGGDTWKSVEGLNAFPGREKWQPGNGGLCLHTILPYPGDADRMLIGISSAGIFATSDGGDSWRGYGAGVRYYGQKKFAEKEDVATCVHKMARDGADPDIVYMQNHAGMHRRKRGDGGWKVIENGLPIAKSTKGTFGFPLAAHPHDRGTVYAIPLEGDYNRVVPGGAMVVYRTENGGKRWEPMTKGLPHKAAYYTILRDGMRTDTNDPAGVYFGTLTGELFASRDDGDSWALVADNLPGVQSVEAGVVGGR